MEHFDPEQEIRLPNVLHVEFRFDFRFESRDIFPKHSNIIHVDEEPHRGTTQTIENTGIRDGHRESNTEQPRREPVVPGQRSLLKTVNGLIKFKADLFLIEGHTLRNGKVHFFIQVGIQEGGLDIQLKSRSLAAAKEIRARSELRRPVGAKVFEKSTP